MSVTTTTDLLQGATRVASRLEAELRALAQRTATRVQVGAQARMRFRTGQMRQHVRVYEDAEKRQFRIQVDDVAGRNPMVPVWHEFGTNNMPAQPSMGPALEEVRSDYAREGERVCETVLGELA